MWNEDSHGDQRLSSAMMNKKDVNVSPEELQFKSWKSLYFHLESVLMLQYLCITAQLRWYRFWNSLNP